MEEYTRSTARSVELLLVYRNELFLLLRDDKPDIAAPLRWGLLSGAIEGDETPGQALHREVMEEIGMSLKLVRLATTPNAVWYFSVLGDIDIGRIRQDEGCGRGFFTMNALRGLAKIEGKGGLGGRIRQLVLQSPDSVYLLLEIGVMPNKQTLSV